MTEEQYPLAYLSAWVALAAEALVSPAGRGLPEAEAALLLGERR
jgi:hypothetical protein